MKVVKSETILLHEEYAKYYGRNYCTVRGCYGIEGENRENYRRLL